MYIHSPRLEVLSLTERYRQLNDYLKANSDFIHGSLVIGASPYEEDRGKTYRSPLYSEATTYLLSTEAPLRPSLDESRFFLRRF